MIIGNKSDVPLVSNYLLRVLEDDEESQVVNMVPSTLPNNRILRRFRRLQFFAQMLSRVDLVLITFPVANDSFYVKLARLYRKKVIYYWIGTDVMWLLDGTTPIASTRGVTLHLADGWNLVKELQEMGIVSALQYVAPPMKDLNLAKVPESHAILLSIPDTRLEFYGYDEMIRLIGAFPEVRFIVTRSERPEIWDFPNVDFRGKLTQVEMQEIYDEVSLVLRYPQHDSTPLVLIEAAIKGKSIIRRDIPFLSAVVVNNFEELSREIGRVVASPPVANTRLHEEAISTFGDEILRESLLGHLHSVLVEESYPEPDIAVETEG